MAGTWEQVAQSSGAHYRTYREDVAQFVQSLREDTVIFSHFIAINAVIGAATNDDRVVIGHLDNCSVSVFEASDEGLSLVEMGGEADTLIR
jgi:broad specificity phosphatase PhoE